MRHITISYPIEERYLSWSCLLRNVFFPVLAGFFWIWLVWGSAKWMQRYGGGRESLINFLVVGGVVFGMALLMFRPLLRLRLAGRKYIAESYLIDGTPLRRLLEGRSVPTFFAATSAVLLSMILYVTLQTMDLIDLACVAIAMTVALLLQQAVACLIASSLKKHVTDVVLRRLGRAFGLGFTVLALAATSIVRDSTSNYRQLSSSEAADQICKDIVHPLQVVEVAARLSKYFEVQLLRMRDQATFPFGWLIYLCFLVPSAFPAYAIVNLVVGCSLPGCRFDAG